ncbi:MAG TPA: TonB family protein [Patescibacteria group bacterium]|nr:TonB family protein [Patescibacteria group bacterium]
MTTPEAGGDPAIWFAGPGRRGVAAPRKWFFSALMTLLLGGSMSPAMNLEQALSRPLSPGALALLIRHAGLPAANRRVAEGLHDSHPATRAAAARVAAVTRIPGLRGDLLQSLEHETDVSAAREEIRALALEGDLQDQPLLIESARRFGWGTSRGLAMTLARDLGSEALPIYFKSLRSADWTESDRLAFFELATRRGKVEYDQLAAAVLEQSDPDDWRAVLAQARDERFDLEHGLALRALSAGDPGISAQTAWFLSARYARARPSEREEYLGILRGQSDARSFADRDPDDRFGREILGRVLGETPVTNVAWTARLDLDGPVALDDRIDAGVLRTFLTMQELNALQARYKRRTPAGEPLPKWVIGQIDSTDLLRPPTPAVSTGPAIRTVAGLPPGMVQDLLALTQCKLKHSGDQRAVDARVVYDAMGRPRRVVVSAARGGKPCGDAFEALFTATLPPDEHLPDPAVEERLILFEDPEFLSHMEGEPVPQVSLRLDGSRVVHPPEKTRTVAPSYPFHARNNRENGRATFDIGVTRDGHVTDMRVIMATKGYFLLEAMWAVSQWRYTPARLGDEPVPVRVVVIVDFNLR